MFFDEFMDVALYDNIISNNFHKSAEFMCLIKFIFQQDIYPKHTSKLAKAYSKNNKFMCFLCILNRLISTLKKLLGSLLMIKSRVLSRIIQSCINSI